MLKASQLVGMEIYADSGKQLGKVYDLIIDLQKGAVIRIALEPISASSREEAKRIFREKTISYKSVKAVSQIVIVSSSPVEGAASAEPEEQKPEHFSYRHRYRRP